MSVSAYVTKAITRVKTVTVYAVLSSAPKRVTASAVIKKFSFLKTVTASALVGKQATKTVTTSAVVQGASVKLVNASSVLKKTRTLALTASAALISSVAGTVTKVMTVSAIVGEETVDITGTLTEPDISMSATLEN